MHASIFDPMAHDAVIGHHGYGHPDRTQAVEQLLDRHTHTPNSVRTVGSISVRMTA
jgi:hypothetical protein